MWLINTHNGVKEQGIKPVNIEDYPAIKNHLNKYFPELEKRQDKGNTPYNLRNCAYMEDFFRPKIVWKRIGSNVRFSYDENNYLALDSTCFATGKYIKFLVTVLNSKMGYYLLKDSPKTGTGDLLISVQAIEPIIVPFPSYEIEKQIEDLVDRLKDMNISKQTESEINMLMYALYELTEEEIEFIESN